MRYRLVAAAVLCAGTAAGSGFHMSADLSPKPSMVRVKLDGTIAIFTARYVVPVEKYTYTEAFAGLVIPTQGMVTDATATMSGAVHTLAMVEAKAAEDQFNALAGDEQTDGEHTAAVMLSGSAGEVTLGVAAAHGGVLTLELVVRAPTCFYKDARYVRVPADWMKVMEMARRKQIATVEELAGACDSTSSDEAATWVAFPTPELMKRASGDRLGAFAGRIALGEEHVVHVELDLSAALSDVPRDLATVILVDNSRSMTVDELEAQRQLVASYLKHAPNSRVQVIAFSRRAQPLLPGWTAASLAAGRVDRELRNLAPRNGSNFDVALAEAATWLERVQGTRRVVLITDERMADRLESVSPVALKQVLPERTLVHVVVPAGRDTLLSRTEDSKLAPLAAATDGMAVAFGALDDPDSVDATMLVRPISLDRVKINAPGWDKITPASIQPCGDEPEQRLLEGTSCAWWGEGDASAGPVIVEGLLWGKRVQRLVRPDPGHGREVARELSALSGVDDSLQAKANTAAHAVNDHWSMYAEWGGHEHYSAGFGMGGSGCGCGGDTGNVGTIGHGIMGGGLREPPDLARQLRPLLAACHVEATSVQISLEMTFVEIVDLTAALRPPDTFTPAQRRKQQKCVEDALWDATPMLTIVGPKQTFNVAIEPL